ncbi:MAG: site-specific integrase, partial [Tannerellaceae bacterium]|nr:site-specific integrase [Tannerellaceae bacterium]
MANYSVYLKKENKKGLAPLYVGFYIKREKIEVPVRISIAPDAFDKNKGVIKSSYEYAKDYNLIISDIKASVNDIFVRYRLRKNELTPSLFWKEYRAKGEYKTFFDFCQAYQRLRFQEVTPATQKAHNSCLKKLQEFQGTVYFEDLTEDFFRHFVLFLRNKRKNNENTIRKTMKNLSVYMNEAVKKELMRENPIHGVKLRGSQESDIEALTEEELKRLTEVYTGGQLNETDQKVLAFFLFMCFSSLHITDARNLGIEQIGKNEFCYMRTKMLNVRPRIVHVPISGPLRHLIGKQKGNRTEGALWEGMISDQKVNSKLKKIAGYAGIKKKLSAKVGRHTFATIFLRRTHDLNALKDIMGHSNIKQT